MKNILAILMMCLPIAAMAQRTDWTTWGDEPTVGVKHTSTINNKDIKRLDKIVRAKADTLSQAMGTDAEVVTVRDTNGLLGIKVILGGSGVPAEPNVTGYNAVTRQSLERLTDMLTGAWAKADVTVDGHTDNVGPYDENMTVSFRRAVAVSGLLTRQGVDSSRIVVRGFSYDYPIADNRLIDGRERNRRVEVTITISMEMLGEM